MDGDNAGASPGWRWDVLSPEVVALADVRPARPSKTEKWPCETRTEFKLAALEPRVDRLAQGREATIPCARRRRLG